MIYVTDTLRISKLDEYSLQLEAFVSVVSKKTGATSKQWKRCGYYGDLKSALISAFKKQLYNSADEEIKLSEVIARIDTAEKNIIAAIENANVKANAAT